MENKTAAGRLVDYTPLMIVLLIGALVRLHQLGAESIWLDEAVSIRIAHMSPGEIFEAIKTDNNPPLYYLLLHYWMIVFGDSEVATRMLSATAGVLALGVIYRVGDILFGRPTGLAAALLLALSPFHIRFSQEDRAFALAAFLALLSFYFLLRLSRERSVGVQAGYVLSTSLLMYTHVYGLLVVAAQGVYVITTALLRTAERPPLGRWLVLQAIILMLYIPGFVLLAGWLGSPLKRTWIPMPTARSILDTVTDYAGSSWLLALLGALCVLGALSLVRVDVPKLYMLALWLLVPVALPITISIFYTPLFVDRYGIVALPALYLLAGIGAVDLARAFRKNTAKIAVLGGMAALVVTLSVASLQSYWNTVGKEQWREAVHYLQERAEPNALVVVVPSYVVPNAFDYYLKREDLRVRTFRMAPSGFRQAQRLMSRRNRLWLVVSTEQTNVAFTKSIFDSSLSEDSHREFQGVEVSLYTRER